MGHARASEMVRMDLGGPGNASEFAGSASSLEAAYRALETKYELGRTAKGDTWIRLKGVETPR